MHAAKIGSEDLFKPGNKVPPLSCVHSKSTKANFDSIDYHTVKSIVVHAWGAVDCVFAVRPSLSVLGMLESG